MAAAQTGTGKTAGFTLPLLEILSKGALAKPTQVRALVLTPTRELAAQVAESVTTYGKNLPLRSAVVFGGVKINPQITKLRRGTDVLVATPGVCWTCITRKPSSLISWKYWYWMKPTVC